MVSLKSKQWADELYPISTISPRSGVAIGRKSRLSRLNRLKRKLSLWVLLGLFASCQVASAQQMNIVVIPKGSDHVFWDFIRVGVDKAVTEIGNINLTWRGPAFNDDTPSQIKLVELYTRKQMDAIILVPTDKQALLEPVRKATRAGIKVIVIDSGLDGTDHLSFIGTDNFQVGVLAAQHLSSLLGDKGKVLVLRTVKGSASTDRRAEGFLEEIKNHPEIEVVADEYGGGSLGRSYHFAKKLLEQHSGIHGIFAVNESSTAGMLKALRALNLAAGMQFIGFDASDYLIEGLASGEVEGLIIQNPRQMGYLGVKAAVAALRGEPLAPNNYTGVVVATPGNYQTPDIHGLLYP
jgi:ribose transport system substrate-binding protein